MGVVMKFVILIFYKIDPKTTHLVANDL